MQKQLYSISETAKILGISIDTLRRWDKAGRLIPVRSGPKGHRFYNKTDIDFFLKGIETIAKEWVESNKPIEVSPNIYCSTRDIFQARLEKLQFKLTQIFPIKVVSLVIAIAGEIGNNSFDHNLGSWSDIPGIIFSYTIHNRTIVLADRGQGILTTLKRVKPNLTNYADALRVAFTETISGRYPEARGNGLKFVKSVIEKNPIKLFFQSGNAQVSLINNENDLNIQTAKNTIKGCFAIITFEEKI